MTAPSQVSDQHVFVAYRRECGHAALALARSLRRGGQQVFRDIEGLRGGDVWAETVRAAIEKANALMVLIDRSWNAAGSGKRDPRLWTENDPLRIEIQHAIKHGIPLIPVLIDDAPMPQPTELPQDIRTLCGRHALRLRHTEFETDVQRIALDIERVRNDREAISAVIARLGAAPEQVALPLASGAPSPALVATPSNAQGHVSTARPAADRATTLGFPFERGSVLERLSAFKPSALLESLSHGKSDERRSIFANLSRASAPTEVPNPLHLEKGESRPATSVSTKHRAR